MRQLIANARCEVNNKFRVSRYAYTTTCQPDQHTQILICSPDTDIWTATSSKGPIKECHC